jgi:hypothetical protein
MLDFRMPAAQFCFLSLRERIKVRVRMKSAAFFARCIGLLIFLCVTASPKPPEAKARQQSAPAPPSVELSKFIDANLSSILGPLEQKVPLPRAELKQLHDSYKAHLKAASPAERDQLKAALKVCDAIKKAMDERERAMLGPSFLAAWPQRAAEYRDVVNQLMKKEKATEHQSSVPSH